MPVDIQEKHIKKDKWIKELMKTSDPEQLSCLIKQRIDFPNTTGPYLRVQEEERPTDIINNMIVGYEGFRKKITPAVGLLLYKINTGKLKEDHDLIRGIFHIICVSKLFECNVLVSDWVSSKFDIIDFNNDREKTLYKDGLLALAVIQDKNAENEKWWFDFWKEPSSVFWYGTAIYGLKKQNPEAAAKELGLLVARNPDKLYNILYNMWMDPDFRRFFAAELRKGLIDNVDWIGVVINSLYEKMNTDERKEELMLALKQ